MVERKIRLLLERNGWKVVRAGGSIGEADLVCIRRGKCMFLQVKSTKKKAVYYQGYMNEQFEGIPFYLVVDFGYGKIKVVQPKKIVRNFEGTDLSEFIK
jgi:Holliday junction resolvase